MPENSKFIAPFEAHCFWIFRSELRGGKWSAPVLRDFGRRGWKLLPMPPDVWRDNFNGTADYLMFCPRPEAHCIIWRPAPPAPPAADFGSQYFNTLPEEFQ